MRLLLLIILFCSSSISFAQGEADNWYFGNNAGLNFSSGSPVLLTNGQLRTIEGCSSFSDKEGNLLFYSDGTTVWNKNHEVMSGGTGLKGHPSSTQSAMIIPRPLSNTEYYLFTVGTSINEESPTEGFNYYTIDISLNGGLGAVSAGPIDLNQGKTALWSEKVAAVKSSECNAYWVVSFVQNEFVAYEVTSSGVSTSPVTSLAGYNVSSRRGYLKISPDGTRLAIAHMGAGILAVYDFNAATGVVSNPKQISLDAPADKPYGIEFSSNGNLLYVHASNDYQNRTDPGENNNPENHKSTLYQFDISLASINEILASKVILDNRDLYRGALQLGPDQKIYRTLATSYEIGTNHLGVIEFPNEKGLAASYVHDAINLGPTIGTQGLPPFIASIFSELDIRSSANIDKGITNQSINLCVGSSYTFSPYEVTGVGTYSWKLNEVEIHNESSLSLTDVDFGDSGEYELTIEVTDECGNVIIYEGKFTANVYQPPNITKGYIFELCDIDTNPTDGITTLNLTDKDKEIKGEDTDLVVSYYSSLTDLDNSIPISNATKFTASSNLKVFFKLTNPETGCFDTGELDLFVYPTSLDTYDDIITCENNISTDPLFSDGNGLGNFDFEIQRQIILDLFTAENVNVTFYTSIEDAQTSINQLEGIIKFTSQTIYTKISNEVSNNCISVGKFEAIVNELPKLPKDLEPKILCVDNPIGNPQPHTEQLDATTNEASDSFQWYFNGNPISGATSAIYNANAAGIYTVEVSRKYPGGSECLGYTSFEIQTSNPAVLRYSDVEIIDDSDNNSIRITNTNLGLGIYEFALNDPLGPYQDEPFFENIIAGHHTIYIRDKFDCGISAFEISLLGFPKFFTPNEDGQNDRWNILGLDPDFYVTSKVHIFDRFGKLLKSFDPLNESWDGVFNGQVLPSSDYWFSAELVDNNDTARIRKGHFSLIRR